MCYRYESKKMTKKNIKQKRKKKRVHTSADPKIHYANPDICKL